MCSLFYLHGHFINLLGHIKDDTSYMVKVSGASKKLAEKKGLKKCKETGNTACYVHYSGLKPEY